MPPTRLASITHLRLAPTKGQEAKVPNRVAAQFAGQGRPEIAEGPSFGNVAKEDDTPDRRVPRQSKSKGSRSRHRSPGIRLKRSRPTACSPTARTACWVRGSVSSRSTPSPPRASASPSSTPNSALGCSHPCSTLTNPRHLWSYVAPSAPSSASSTTTWHRPVSGRRPETCHKIQRPYDQEDLDEESEGTNHGTTPPGCSMY